MMSSNPGSSSGTLDGTKMSIIGHGSQVVEVTEDHKYLMDEKELESVLMRKEIKDLPVVLVSVAGAYRAGKSFLLNFFLRYLTSSKEAQESGSWLSVNSKRLEGFSWRGGSKRNTTGILLWSEPIVTTTSAGEKVAVVLMDTQGTFDSTSTVKDCSTIFALSTLMSSVQIYNLRHNIQEDDLQHLQLFTEYGRLVKDSKSGKAFQVLEFLVRDWQFPWEFAYGAAGGDKLLEERLKVDDKMSPELKDLRAHIRASFEKISGYLMPHPGFKVLNPQFKGDIADIDPEFREHLCLLISSIFGPEKLQPKVINGEKVKARDLFTYFQAYLKVFNSDKIPTPHSIMEATAEAGLLSAVHDGLANYVADMDRDCGEKAPSVPAVDVKVLHEKYKKSALDAFDNKKKMGSVEDAKKYHDKLSEDIDSRAQQFSSINIVKQQKAKEAAKNAYEKVIKENKKDDLFCVHPADLEAIHKSAMKAAMKTFDDAQKRYTEKTNAERSEFETNLERQYQLLKHNNDANNTQIINELSIEYWQYMARKTLGQTLKKDEFEKVHQEGMDKSLESFKNRRSRPDSYVQDVFKFKLVELITMRYKELKELNEKALNKEGIMAALAKYAEIIDKAWDQRRQCLHPVDLQHEHQSAVCQAVKLFRPEKNCSSGQFTATDEDEEKLKNMLESRYKDLFNKNDVANNAAIVSAMIVYHDTLAERKKPNWWWLLGVPIIVNAVKTVSSSYHEESKADALNHFYTKRRNKGPESTDTYRQRLIYSIDDEDGWKKFFRSIKEKLGFV